MAIISSNDIQAVLDAAGGPSKVVEIQTTFPVSATIDEHYCVGLVTPYAGKARWCRVTPTDNAATQGASILAQMAV
jgi:hypothetical protein